MIDAASSAPSRTLPVIPADRESGRPRLAGPDRYAAAAARLRRCIRGGAPDPALVEGWWSARDRRSVSLLALALRAQGIAVSGLHVRAALAAAAWAPRPRS